MGIADLMALDATAESRFWSSVAKSPEGCWLWTAGKISSGYGAFWIKNHLILAHRFSYFLTNGSIGKLFVCHRCDVKLCVKPDHLFAGTHSDNMTDMSRKGRHYMHARRNEHLGENANAAKLTDEQADEVRFRYSMGGVSQRALAAEYGINQRAIWEIIHEHSYQTFMRAAK